MVVSCPSLISSVTYTVRRSYSSARPEGTPYTRRPSLREGPRPARGRYRRVSILCPRRRGPRQRPRCTTTWPRPTRSPHASVRRCAPASRLRPEIAAPPRRYEPPPIRRRHLRRSELDRQLVDRAGELERQPVAVVHTRAGVHADVECFVKGHGQRYGVLDRLAIQLLPVHREHAGAAFAWAGTVVFEVEHDGVFAGLERFAEQVSADPATQPAFPADSFQVQHV